MITLPPGCLIVGHGFSMRRWVNSKGFPLQYYRPDTVVRAVREESFVEVHRGPWLRLVGTVGEKSIAEKKSCGSDTSSR